jgi:DNA-binding CsgD family transcriptional regulator
VLVVHRGSGLRETLFFLAAKIHAIYRGAVPAWLESNDKRYSLADSCAIGRLPENDLVLNDAAVSRRHALIHAHGRAGYWLVDFGSSNGVSVNGRRVFEPVQLRDLDRITVGSYSLVFRERRESGSPRVSAGAAAWKTTERITETFAPVNHGAILLDQKGNINTITDQARQWLGSYFGAASSSKNLPAKLRAWVGQQLTAPRPARGSPSEVLFITKGNKRLGVQLAERNQEHQLLLLTEEQTVFATELLQTLGLTPKESEVLHWLAEGKTNPEIGVILDASPRTIGKHVEHIFAKLGVESRTAALLYVVEKLSKGIR